MDRSAFSLTSRRAFTIIELLVVIGIIAILVALGLVVASKVSGSGKQRATEQVLRALDAALAQYISANGGNPPPTVEDPRPGGFTRLIAVIDGRNFTGGGAGEMINSVGLFMLQCRSVPAADAELKKLDSRLAREYDPDQPDSSPTTPNFQQQPMLLTAFDGWGNPIRYVHPAFKGVVVADPTSATADRVTVVSRLGPAPSGKAYAISDVRRADGSFTGGAPFDADGGIPPSNRPYFYSCGPDGDPTTTDDNIYLTTPKFVVR